MQAMMKPTYTAIVQHAKSGKPAIVFVPTRKHVRLTAVYLMTYSSVENEESLAFWLQFPEELIPFVGKISEQTLRELYLKEWTTCMRFAVLWGTIVITLGGCNGPQYYDGREKAHTDYSFTDPFQMMRFLHEAFPVESHLHHVLHENFNAEVVAGVVENKQDAVNYLTWTFVDRRLTQNPNSYNLQGVSHRHLSDHHSELVENTLSDLESSKCIAIEDDMDLYPLNLGMTASHYCISYTTIERFSSSLTSKTKMKGLLEILASASEYAQLPI
ncbi:hypothetical protein SLEP1_g11244 [Rubroshorea leprosula]|uniref:Uncharacterized protein n=1 Tax=Rubroshorea leprosula TaxID=152421 RepID=A0AAV5IAP8_9ROSI|nr:hypothetical protein SLEP1_g11244 [Rubroshorea leprosula]